MSYVDSMALTIGQVPRKNSTMVCHEILIENLMAPGSTAHTRQDTGYV